MNAILSAQSLPWRESAAFNPALVVGEVDPVDVYEFIGHATFDADFRDRVVADTREVLARFRLPAVGRLDAPEQLAPKLALRDDERVALDALAVRARGTDVDGLRALEVAAQREGVGMPAIAALVLVVAVAVFVAVFLYSHPKP